MPMLILSVFVHLQTRPFWQLNNRQTRLGNLLPQSRRPYHTGAVPRARNGSPSQILRIVEPLYTTHCYPQGLFAASSN
jgi:hypothetical protein